MKLAVFNDRTTIITPHCEVFSIWPKQSLAAMTWVAVAEARLIIDQHALYIYAAPARLYKILLFSVNAWAIPSPM